MYGTSTGFLELFGLKSLKDLPTLREFTELNEDSKRVVERELGDTMETQLGGAAPDGGDRPTLESIGNVHSQHTVPPSTEEDPPASQELEHHEPAATGEDTHDEDDDDDDDDDDWDDDEDEDEDEDEEADEKG